MDHFVKKIQTGLILMAMFMLLPSCIDYDFEPPVTEEPPVGTLLTLQELRQMYQEQPIRFEEDYSFMGVITMDDKSGNIYREAYIQSGNAGLQMRTMSPGGLYEGDSVRVYLKGTTLSAYMGMLQLDSVHVDENIFKKATRVAVEPRTLTIPQINASVQGQLIRLEGVQFIASELGHTFADADNLVAESRMLQDCQGNSIIVRTSGYAAFADHLLPEGRGTLVAVVSQYRNDMQLLIRRMEEVNLDGPRCP